jgi:hypothetical protein
VRLSADFLPQNVSDAHLTEYIERVYEYKHEDKSFNLRVTLHGRVAMVVAWYYDGMATDFADFSIAARLIRRIPSLLVGRFDRFTESDLFFLFDALASFTRRDEHLEIVLEVVRREWQKKIREREAADLFSPREVRKRERRPRRGAGQPQGPPTAANTLPPNQQKDVPQSDL